MNLKIVTLVVSSLLMITSCKDQSNKEVEKVSEQEKRTITFQNKGHELVHNMVEKVGSYQKLRSKKDVEYTYTYTTPDGKADISTEKYIFDGELSYGKYEQHERTLPELEGVMEQGYDGKEYWLKVNASLVNDSTALKRVKFNRPTNFYWFTMFQKLLDPGLIYEYLGETEIADKSFDIVKISFKSQHNKPTDVYQLYINKETQLVDQFLFTVAEFGVVDEPLLMQLNYEEKDGFLIPSKRKYKKSTWDAVISDEPWILVDWSNIKFNINLERQEFQK
ncbi:MAG: hypothetical protein WBB24_17120 [Maribacter sp.]